MMSRTTETKSDTGEVDLNVQATFDDGLVELDTNITGPINAGFGDLTSLGSRDNVDVAYIPSFGRGFIEGFREAVLSVERQISFTTEQFATGTRDFIPDELKNIASDSGQLETVIFGQDIGGQDELNFTKRLSFPEVTAPRIARDAILSLPNPSVTVEARPREIIQSTFGKVPRVEFEIPLETIFEFKSVEDIPCLDQFPTAGGLVESAVTKVGSFRSVINSREDSLQDIRSELIGMVSGADQLTDLSPQSLREEGLSRLRTIRSRVESIDVSDGVDDEARSVLNDALDEVGRMESGECKSEFQSRLNTVSEQFAGANSTLDDAQQLKSRILDLLEGIESIDCSELYSQIDSEITDLEDEAGIGSFTSPFDGEIEQSVRDRLLSDVDDVESDIGSNIPSDSPCGDRFRSRLSNIRGEIKSLEESVLGCGDVSRELRNAVASFESAVDTFKDKRFISRTPSRQSSLISEGRDVRQRLEREIEDDNPCKDRLLSRVNFNVGELRDIRIASEEDLPCDQRFSSLSSDVNELEERVIDLGSSPTAADVDEIISEVERLQRAIQNTAGGSRECTREFSSRLSAIADRVGSSARRVRVVTEADVPSAQERQEKLEEIEAQLEELEASAGDVEEAAREAGIEVPDRGNQGGGPLT